MSRKRRAPSRGPTGPFLVAFTVTCTYRVPVGRVGADQAIAVAREMFEVTRPEHRRAWLTGGGEAHDFQLLDTGGEPVAA